MLWVKSFYEKQHEWGNVYGGDVEPWHRDKAQLVTLPDCQSRHSVLELGCGGGQEAAALADLAHLE